MIDNLWAALGLLALAAAVITVAGTVMAKYADRFADRTGLGEAVTGTVVLGLLTALPGLAASVAAARDGLVAMSITNAIGGIAIQTTALAVADLFHSKANLEHAAASLTNMLQTAVLIGLLTLVMTGLAAPEVTLLHIHPITLILFGAAAFGFYLVFRIKREPMWKPLATVETVPDVPEGAHEENRLAVLISVLAVAGLATIAGGVLAEYAAKILVAGSGVEESLVGGLFLASVTSLPEIVTSVAAVRRGALTLAVGDIIGGNFFDVLFVCTSDLAYVQGSLYHAPGVGANEFFLTSVTILLNVVLLLGLLYRQKHGPANIGFESVLMLVIYVVSFVVIGVS